ncbi:gluconate 2-dehydrogenase subunit 3 family protein [Sandaracinomonas limnophila]|uniref:Gluconate 2-dehydrogenase subunit 3 family protein n=1 Tax=Sandaracinomonas limnophila TaxID=1862386 RepID=A0A437PPH5_9BACT|nr:gluconate 2-dehydrogenase subunit 3 family protein [Sandaracinomonas limnophila]RVU24172.1 gluconate 2-dehydrogenase subunit 3 family protein [Sandaracinomonas limnophila]
MVNRREAVSRIAMMLGGAFTAPTLFAMERSQNSTSNPFNAAALSLTEAQSKIIAAVAEHIIPKTTTAGAIDAGVPAFIEKMINDCYKAPEQKSFMTGVKNLEKAGFLGLDAKAQVSLLKLLEADTAELMKSYKASQVKVGDNVDKEVLEGTQGVPFWRLIKELTLLGYYTSEAGVKASFVYEPIPGKFEPTKYKAGQKAFLYQ